MKLLIDTHLLIWAADDSQSLPAVARDLMENPENTPIFSVASLWEIGIKGSLGRPDFQVDSRVLRRGLLDAGYEELSIQAAHAFEVITLPPLHKDPFDRILIGQAVAEGIILLTHDDQIRQYDVAPIRYV
ncbi:type II toxin-antitoxin system VapC family toxin [Pandoraea sputorum]|uniref:type II toxin-antitoxin system VapC family toxin n=1 Tax=Pandoraea sputorum TaxID=93222 RepID=UPI001240DA9C|nr:type II toxin-antitoxin system VapC family toxin [Pandoraea sputorum]VVE58446.1 twitching motility protein PilT [Pandoraea sputorum]